MLFPAPIDSFLVNNLVGLLVNDFHFESIANRMPTAKREVAPTVCKNPQHEFDECINRRFCELQRSLTIFW